MVGPKDSCRVCNCKMITEKKMQHSMIKITTLIQQRKKRKEKKERKRNRRQHGIFGLSLTCYDEKPERELNIWEMRLKKRQRIQQRQVWNRYCCSQTLRNMGSLYLLTTLQPFAFLKATSRWQMAAQLRHHVRVVDQMKNETKEWRSVTCQAVILPTSSVSKGSKGRK